MKKLINLKEIMIILISVMLIAFATNVFAIDSVLGNDNTSTINQDEYKNAQQPEVENTNTNTNTNTNINTNSNTNNTAKTYNTNNNKDDLPQTGIEDYNIGILLIICVASAIFAYKKAYFNVSKNS